MFAILFLHIIWLKFCIGNKKKLNIQVSFCLLNLEAIFYLPFPCMINWYNFSCYIEIFLCFIHFIAFLLSLLSAIPDIFFALMWMILLTTSKNISKNAVLVKHNALLTKLQLLYRLSHVEMFFFSFYSDNDLVLVLQMT